ncbi:MAG: class I SAM-dependent methyltransferase [Planctomycetota bacterium]|nr:MAG: class I SAM-dependent methyltransferase [Planctomycetota bacterium]
MVKQLAEEYIARGDPLGWHEELYRLAGGDPAVIPWADMKCNVNFLEWVQRCDLHSEGKTALVIGCGLGDDAEALARLNFEVTAFDISPTAIEWCRKRFPDSKVRYLVADLFEPGELLQRKYDFILEVYTLQVLPPNLQQRAMSCIAHFLTDGGTLLVITRGRDDEELHGSGMHWRLSHGDLNGFVKSGLREVSFEDYMDQEDPPVRRFRVEYSR